MNQQIKRRHFLKTSVIGVGGFFAMGFGVKKYTSRLVSFDGGYLKNLDYNEWNRILHENYGARRFSSFRYVPDINRFLLWGFHAYNSYIYGNPENPWTDNEEYDIVAFNPDTGLWENHLPEGKLEDWSENLPPMHLVSYYHGVTPGYYRPQLKNRGGVLRPDLNIIGDQVTYDSKRQQMVYFTGGRTFTYHVKDNKWSAIDSKQAPPPVSFGSLCHDPKHDRLILFGGGHVAEFGPNGSIRGYTGTWVYDFQLGNWFPLETSSEPPPRMCTRLVYDSKNEVMAVFGGDGQSCWRADTWLLDLEKDTWYKGRSGVAPEARAGHFTVFDPSTGWIIVGGGYNHEELTDMWGYDVISDTWRKLQGNVPVGWYITADIIPDESTIVLTTSTRIEGDTRGCDEVYPVRTTWAYRMQDQDLVDETVIPVTEREISKRSIEQATLGTEPDPDRYRNQKERIRKMPDNHWIHFDNPGRDAPLRTWGSCAFDTNKGRIIYWGGGHCGYGSSDYDFYDVEQNTWIPGQLEAEYPERAWNRGINIGGVTFNGAPWVRHGRKVYAFDPISNKVINTKIIYLTAGYDPDPLKNIKPKNPNFGEKENFSRSFYTKWATWVYHEEPQRWEIICSGYPGLDLLVQTPHGVMGVDHNWGAVNSEERPDMSVWKGDPMVDNSVYLLDVAGRQWKKLTREGPWPQNLYEMTALVYDSRRDQLILHGGGEERDELWRFPLSTGRWEKIEPQFSDNTNGHPPVCRREAVYLPNDDLFFTVGQPAGDGSEPAFWTYRVEENHWHKVDIKPPEGLTMDNMRQQNRAWTYDPVHDIVFMIIDKRVGNSRLADLYGIRYKHES